MNQGSVLSQQTLLNLSNTAKYQRSSTVEQTASLYVQLLYYGVLTLEALMQYRL